MIYRIKRLAACISNCGIKINLIKKFGKPKGLEY